jgi:hypothetical protein
MTEEYKSSGNISERFRFIYDFQIPKSYFDPVCIKGLIDNEIKNVFTLL